MSPYNRSQLVLLLFLMLGMIGCDATPNAPMPTAEIAATQPTATAVSPTAPPQPTSVQPPASLSVAGTQPLTMQSVRAAHTATKLPDGRILLTGGFTTGEETLRSTELFDPKQEGFSPEPDMNVSRQSHTATLLANGKVLIAGGFNGSYLNSAELFDPATGQFEPTGQLQSGRSGHQAIRLETGEVLLIGGVGEGWSFLASAEIYNPVSGEFRAVGSMQEPRESHTATLLQTGEVLVTGGHSGRRANITIYASTEIFNPVSESFRPAAKLQTARHKHDATRLEDGRVLITGGADENDRQGRYVSTEIYDPLLDRFNSAPDLHAPRYKHTQTTLLLPNGQVMLTGGGVALELYNPLTNSFTSLAEVAWSERLFATATPLDEARILFAGGYGSNISTGNQAWIIQLQQADPPS